MASSTSQGAQRKVNCYVKECALDMNDFKTTVKLNVLPLGSYDLLIGIDWLEKQKVVLNCFDKTFTCVNNNEQPVTVKGIPRKTVIRQISSLQLKRAVRKGCKAYAVTITDEASKSEKDKITIEIFLC